MVGRHGGKDDVINLGPIDLGVGQGGHGGAQAQVAGGGAGLDVIALLDAAALADPGVGGVHQAGELFVLDEVLAERKP